jgi:hypothetical protein
MQGLGGAGASASIPAQDKGCREKVLVEYGAGAGDISQWALVEVLLYLEVCMYCPHRSSLCCSQRAWLSLQNLVYMHGSAWSWGKDA